MRKRTAGAAPGHSYWSVRGIDRGTPLASSRKVSIAGILQSIGGLVIIIKVILAALAFRRPGAVVLDVLKHGLHAVEKVGRTEFGGQVTPFLLVGVIHTRADQTATFDESLTSERRRLPRAKDVDIHVFLFIIGDWYAHHGHDRQGT